MIAVTLGLIGVFLFTVVLQGLFAGYEIGFVASNPIRVRYLAEEEKNSRAKRLFDHIQQPDQMLTLLLIGNNVTLVVGTVAITRAFGGFPYAEAAATIVATPLFLLFSEIIPKSIFRVHPTQLSLAFLPVVQFIHVCLLPVTRPIALFTRSLLRLAGHEREHLSPFMSTLEDVRILVDESAAHGALEQEEQRMIHSIIDLNDTQAKAIMTPRIDIQALSDTATREELVDLFERSGKTRIPIYHETIDTVAGVINVYDVMLDEDTDNPDITRFLREVMHVPDTMPVDDLLTALKRKQQHLAIVTDEYGGTDGLVTLEDILEEIFGDIQDEHDKEEEPIHQVGPHAFVVDARMPLEEVAEAIGAPMEDAQVDTIGGWLMHVAGRIPTQGEVIRRDPFRMTVLAGGDHYISRIRLEIVPEERKNDAEQDQAPPQKRTS